VSDLNEQAEAFRKLNDEQLKDLFELLHWVVREDNVPAYIYRIAINLLSDKQQEMEADAQVKTK